MTKKMIQEGHIKDSKFVSFFKGMKIKEITPKAAFEWALNKAKKVKSGKNYCRLGNCYDFGIGTKKNFREANKYYLMAAKMDDAIAQYNIAFSYYEGDGIGRNFKKSFYWMKKAAENGYGEALADLGYYYIQGVGIKADSKKALLYYRKAARKKIPRAFYNIGLMYESGDGVVQSKKMAKKFFDRAAKSGHQLRSE